MSSPDISANLEQIGAYKFNNTNAKRIIMVGLLKWPKTKFTLFTLVFISSTIMPFMPLRSNWFFKEPPYGVFKQIETYSEIKNIFDACDENTLITFDVDSTLIMSHDVMANFEFPSIWFAIRALLKYPELIWNKKSIEPILSVVFEQAERFVFDPDIVPIIQQLQKQNCKTVALTMMWNGAYGNIKNMPEWRASMLEKFNINFDEQFPDTEFKSLPKNRGLHPCLYKGILCTNHIDKGKVLGAFLDHNKFKPTLIISFDDQKKQLNSIASECAKRKIAFSGYQMVGWKKYCNEWNTSRALLQLDFLMNDKVWLTDSEADAILSGEIKSA